MADADERPWRPVADGLLIAVRLTPKGGRDALDGIELLSDGAPVLKARVRAAAHAGAANAALLALLAKELGVAAGRVSLTAGASGRRKTLKVEGDRSALAAALERLCRRSAA